MNRRSKIIPYRRGESPQERHARRLQENLRRREQVESWCRTNGITLRIHNGGQHWRFVRGERVAEWWPSSARLVLQADYRNDQHVHDYQQAIDAIARHFRRRDAEPSK